MPGNDIIDISQTRLSTNWRRKGFLQKVFRLKEQELVKRSADPFITVWRMWSMKESAYKLYLQQGHERFFNPSLIHCKFLSESLGEVHIRGMKMKTYTEMSSEFIFTTASFEQEEGVESSIFSLTDDEAQSETTHQKSLQFIAVKHRLSLEHLQLKKTSQNIPQIFYLEQKLPIAVSLTHHGNYGACSILVKQTLTELINNRGNKPVSV
jgi:phosphopantetheinyl transferase (holo-ACP synthase)